MKQVRMKVINKFFASGTIKRLAIGLVFSFVIAAYGETISQIDEEGYFDVATPSRMGVVLSGKIVKSDYDYKTDLVELKINDSSVASMSEKQKRRKYAAWEFESSQIYDSGTHKVGIIPTSDWISKPSACVVVWKDAGRDIPVFARDSKTDLERTLAFKDYNSASFILEKVSKMRKIVHARRKFLIGYNELLDKTKTESDSIRADCVNLKTAYETDLRNLEEAISNSKNERKRFEENALVIENQLKEAKQNGDVSETSKLTMQLGALKKNIDSCIEVISELERSIDLNKTALGEVDQTIQQTDEFLSLYPDEKNLTESEILLRDEDYQTLLQISKDYDAKVSKGATVSNDGDGNVTIVEKKDEGYNFGEVFGIACIPACAIALPVGVGASIAYTELTRPSPQSGYEISENEAGAEGAASPPSAYSDENVESEETDVQALRDRNDETRTRANYIKSNSGSY